MTKYNIYLRSIIIIVSVGLIVIKLLFTWYLDTIDIKQMIFMLEMQELLSFKELNYDEKILDQTYYSNILNDNQEKSMPLDNILQKSWNFCKEHKMIIFGSLVAFIGIGLIGWSIIKVNLDVNNVNQLNHNIAMHIRTRGFYYHCINTLNGANGISTYIPNDLANLILRCPPAQRFILFNNIQIFNGQQTIFYLPGKIELFSDDELVFWYRSWQTWVEARLNDWNG